MATVDNYLFWSNDNDPNSNPLFPKKLRAIISGSSGCGKTVLLTNMILHQWIDFKKLIIVSGSLSQHIYQVLIHGFQKKIPPHMLKNLFEAKDYLKKNNKEIKEICQALGADLTKSQKYDIEVESYEDPSKLPDVQDIGKDTLVIFDDLMTDKSAQKKSWRYLYKRKTSRREYSLHHSKLLRNTKTNYQRQR